MGYKVLMAIVQSEGARRVIRRIVATTLCMMLEDELCDVSARTA
jgi:hypothetical protein